jgi:protein-S-isoprenylcysteine O-methyltransferase Ste14
LGGALRPFAAVAKISRTALEVSVNRRQKDAANVRFFPPGIPLLIIAVGIALNHYWPFNLANEVPELVRYMLGGAIAASALLGLGAWSVIIMRRSGQSENPWKPTLSIIERGPFRISRNPMYLQMVVVCFGVAVGLMNGWLFILTPFCGWLLQQLAIIPEEKYLEQKFGDSYLAYKKRVRRWI